MIQQLATDEARALEQLRDVRAEREMLKELSVQLMESARKLTSQLDRLREQHRRVADAYRELREQVMRDADRRRVA